MNGKPNRIRVTDKNNNSLYFNSASEASFFYYPERPANYIATTKMRNNKDFFRDEVLGLSFYRVDGDWGRTHNQKKYRVVYRNGLEEYYNSRKELLAALDIGQRSFSQQLKHYGNYKNSEFQIWEI